MRNIYPAWRDLFERTHIVKVDVDYDLAGVLLTDNVRLEWYNLESERFNDSSYNLETQSLALTRADDRQSYFQGANTFRVEKQVTDWLLAGGGYLYSKLNSQAAMAVDTFNAAALDPSIAAPGWHADRIDLERESHLFSLSAVLGPWQGLNLSVAVQNEWTRQQGIGSATVDLALSFVPLPLPVPPEQFHSDIDRAIFSQTLGLRYTKIPFTSLFAEARLQEEDLGLFEEEAGGLTPFLRDTDARSHMEDFRAGFNTSPWRRVGLFGQFRRSDRQTDYDNITKTVIGYPGFFLWREILSNEAEAKLSLQTASWLKTSLGYKWLATDYRNTTEAVDDPLTLVPGGITPGTKLLAGTYEAHITSIGATITRWRRLFLNTGFSWQNARTVTASHDSPSVAPYAGNIFSFSSSANYNLNTSTDISAGYVFSLADFSQENFAAGLPLGIRYQQHSVEIGLNRHISKNSTFGVRYRFYYYDEPSSGTANNFHAQAVFATIGFRL
jgi:hypothetical protein